MEPRLTHRVVPRLTLLACLGAPTAHASSPAEVTLARLEECSWLSDDGVRLVCYDETLRRARSATAVLPALPVEIARVTPSTAPPPASASPPGGAGRWLVIADEDRMSRRPILTAMLSSDTTTVAGALAADLVVQCDRGALHVYFSWGRALQPPVEVTPLLGQGEPRPRAWPLSDDGEATFVGGDPWSFVDEIVPVDKLVLRVDAADLRPTTTVFDVRGLRELVPELMAACPRP